MRPASRVLHKLVVHAVLHRHSGFLFEEIVVVAVWLRPPTSRRMRESEELSAKRSPNHLAFGWCTLLYLPRDLNRALNLLDRVPVIDAPREDQVAHKKYLLTWGEWPAEYPRIKICDCGDHTLC